MMLEPLPFPSGNGDVTGICNLKSGSYLKITEPKNCHLSLSNGKGCPIFSVKLVYFHFFLCIIISKMESVHRVDSELKI